MTCRGVTKRGEPCRISFGLDAGGFCKYHVPDAAQCLGTCRTSGQRCRVKWGLDACGYCEHHRSQAPLPPVSAAPGACRGVTKRGSPCSVTWALDADGFCKYHAPNAAQCRGIARASGRRCKIKWGLDARGYCQFHRRVDAPATQQCEAVLPATGRRCPQTVGIDADGFCTAHRAVNTELPRCLGVLPGSDKRCRSNAKTGYDYCCAAHDPKFAATFVPPSLFNDPGLRSSVEAEIVRRFKGRDLYHGDKLDLNTVGAVELDHILEKQCFAYAFQRVEFRDGEEEAQDVAFMLREEIVNELPNLCLTRATTNKMKGAAVSRFLDDSLTGHRGEKTFTDYMLAEKRDDTRLARDVTRTIRSEMGTALRRCQWKLWQDKTKGDGDYGVQGS
ncbi:Myosin protein [Phytophthora cinnamomi]|uniref:Myosin protein n=1 Tax=Phytophthora cinnamomi TaxID=4785 RepID=UPI00355A2CAF|nr:Myosin protein [Phytophthora cinnamomi]